MADIVWAVPPDPNVRRRFVRRSVQTPPDGGFVQRRQLVDREFQQYTLSWANARRAVLTVLEYYWAETKRGVLPMLYTPPGESEIRVHMASLTVRWTSAHGGEAEVVLEAIR